MAKSRLAVNSIQLLDIRTMQVATALVFWLTICDWMQLNFRRKQLNEQQGTLAEVLLIFQFQFSHTIAKGFALLQGM